EPSGRAWLQLAKAVLSGQAIAPAGGQAPATGGAAAQGPAAKGAATQRTATPAPATRAPASAAAKPARSTKKPVPGNKKRPSDARPKSLQTPPLSGLLRRASKPKQEET